jgi:hypothetical protein
MINLTREEAQQVLHSLLNYPMTEGKAIELLRAKLNEPPCKTGSSCTNKCERCGEVNPAEIHTCTPEPMIDGWPLYSGLPQRKWVGLTEEEKTFIAWESNNGPHCVELTEAKLKEKNT